VFALCCGSLRCKPPGPPTSTLARRAAETCYLRAFASRVTSSKRRTTLPGQVGQFPGSDSHRLGVWLYGLHPRPSLITPIMWLSCARSQRSTIYRGRMHQDAASSDILDRAAQFYTDHLTAPVLGYLADRGFPEAFVRQRRIGYAPVSSSSRNLLVREIRSTTRSNGTRLLQEAIEAGLVVQDKTGAVRDFFASETTGYVLFPNSVHESILMSVENAGSDPGMVTPQSPLFG